MSPAKVLDDVLLERRLSWSPEDRALVARCAAHAVTFGFSAVFNEHLSDATRQRLLTDVRNVKAQAANITAAAAQDLDTVLHETVMRLCRGLGAVILGALA